MNGIDLKNFNHTNLSSDMKFATKNELTKSTVNMNFQTEANLTLDQEKDKSGGGKSKKKKKNDNLPQAKENKKEEVKVVTDYKKIMNII